MRPDWMKTRLIVVGLAILGPVYFLIFTIFLSSFFQIAPFGDSLYNQLFHFLVVPIIFSTPWVGIIYYSRYRLANTAHLMEETTVGVPLRWRLFYGTNAAFVLMFFILPLTTPVLAVIGGLYVGGHVFYTVGMGKMGGGKVAAFLAIIVALALCILPIYIMIVFIPNYLIVWEAILQSWSDFWFQVVYGVAQCLVNALSFGAPIYFFYFAASEYDRGIYGISYTKTPTTWIRVFELILFFSFLVVYLPPIPTPLGTITFLDMSWLFQNYINWASTGVVVIMILVKRGLKVEDNSTLGGTSNILIVGMFLVVELFFKTDLLIVTLIIWLAFILFAIITALNFARASPREMY